MTALVILLSLVGLLVVGAGAVIGVMIWMGRRLRGAEAWVRAQVADGERFLLEPAVGNYRGATGRFGAATAVAMVAVTARQVVVAKALGARFVVPIAELRGVREAPQFLQAQNGMPTAILTLTDGVELGLQIRDQASLVKALRTATRA